MELSRYIAILRRFWPIVLALPLLTALISLGAAWVRPQSYSLTASILLTRAQAIQVDTEDVLAYDLPAILKSSSFARLVSEELARRGRTLAPEAIQPAFRVNNEHRVMLVTVTAATPEDARAIMDAAIFLVETHGLQLWGEREATPEQPGVNVAVLNLPEQPAPQKTIRSMALEIGLRTLIGLASGVAVAFGLHYLRPATESTPI